MADLPLWRHITAPRRRRACIERLARERDALITQLDQLKERYLTETTT